MLRRCCLLCFDAPRSKRDSQIVIDLLPQDFENIFRLERSPHEERIEAVKRYHIMCIDCPQKPFKCLVPANILCIIPSPIQPHAIHVEDMLLIWNHARDAVVYDSSHTRRGGDDDRLAKRQDILNGFHFIAVECLSNMILGNHETNTTPQGRRQQAFCIHAHAVDCNWVTCLVLQLLKQRLHLKVPLVPKIFKKTFPGLPAMSVVRHQSVPDPPRKDWASEGHSCSASSPACRSGMRHRGHRLDKQSCLR